jgi:hypothetical protein
MLTPQSINEPIGRGGIDIDANPPRVTGVSPAGCTVGDPPFTINVSGMDIPETAVVTIGGIDLPTTFVSPTELTAEVTTDGVVAGGYPVTFRVGGLEAYPAVMFTVSE